MDKLTALEHAYAIATPVVAAATPADYRRPTPCTEWDVEALLSHLIRVVDQFPTVIAGEKADWSGPGFTDDPAASLAAATAANLAAWRRPGAADMPGRLPGTQLIDLNLIDTTMHTWDLAQAIDYPLAVDEELAAFVLALASETPVAEQRGRAFGPEVPVAADAPTIDRLAGFLGRHP
jgi:uncharacterized protein (TIGR03086 family)